MIEDARYFLITEFNKRKEVNPAFSLRSFSRWLDSSPAQISQIFSGKRAISKKLAKKIIEKLKLSPVEQLQFLDSLDPEVVAKKKKVNDEDNKTILEEDKFAIIADWPHFSLLSLSEIKDSYFDTRWLARRLGLPYQLVRESLDRLLRLELIKIKDGKFYQTKKNLTTPKNIVSNAIQRHHKQNLKLAMDKIDSVDVSMREFSSVTMAINSKNIPKAKELITKFKRNLCELLEEGEPDEVYTLSIQLFPNTVLNVKEEKS